MHKSIKPLKQCYKIWDAEADLQEGILPRKKEQTSKLRTTIKF